MSVCKQNGFTLVELLVAMAIGMVVLLLAGLMLRGVGESYGRLSGNVSTDREARELMRRIVVDFSSAVYHPDQVFEKGGDSWRKDRAGILTLQRDVAQSKAGRNGDLCAVHYHVADLTMGGKTTRCLMRGFRESGETMSELRENRVSSLFTVREDADDPVAFGIVFFEIIPMLRNPSGKWEEWDSSASLRPQACEIRFAIASKEASARLKTPSDWEGGNVTSARLLGNLENVSRNRHLKIYQTLIHLGYHEIP